MWFLPTRYRTRRWFDHPWSLKTITITTFLSVLPSGTGRRDDIRSTTVMNKGKGEDEGNARPSQPEPKEMGRISATT